ncbi:MAG TPA: DUF6776 family protein [Pseudomonadales bacterium]
MTPVQRLHRYRHLLLFMLVACLLGGLSSAAIWYWPLQRELQLNAQQLAHLQQEHQDVLRRMATCTVESDVLRSSKQALREALDAQQMQLAEQEKSLDFFRQLMTPGTERDGLELSSYSLTSLPVSGQILYRLTFVQYAKKHPQLKARLSIRVQGLSQGQETVYALKDLLAGGSELPERLDFRYFQVLEGHLQIPQDFEPQALLVEAVPIQKNAAPLVRTLNWQLQEQ